MRSAEHVMTLALLATLAACASAPEVVKKPVEAVPQPVLEEV